MADENMDDHHIIYRQLGGSDALSSTGDLNPIRSGAMPPVEAE